jgi:hypothetical protein
VQDVWTSIDGKSGEEIPWGTTIRFYDPKIDAWRSTWVSPRQGAVKTFIGRKVGEKVVLERRNEDGHSVRWVFSEISQDSFRWHSEESLDGESWAVREAMRVRRRQG